MCRHFFTLVALTAACLALWSVVAPSATLAEQQYHSYLRVGETGRQIMLGLNKSIIVELPREAREVMVPNPDKIDAVLQTSTRAYLIGKAVGEANVLFLDKDGKQVANLDVTIGRDLSALGNLLTRLLPGSNIKVETVGERTVLTGSVTDPVDAPRACEIVTSYLGKIEDEENGPGSGGANVIVSSGKNSKNDDDEGSKSCNPKNVINLLTVEGKEQVLLKVSVVEMERNIIKQFGIDLNALVQSGNFAFAALSDLPFPFSAKGALAPFLPSGSSVAGTAGGGVGWQSGGSHVQTVLRALEEDGLLHTLAEPNSDCNFWRDGQFSRRR